MRFENTGIISSSADTGDPVVIFRPEIRIRVHGPKASRDFWALVDTGADNTILPESVARTLGIVTAPGKGPAATAFGGQEVALSYADAELEILHEDGALRWLAHVYFAAGSTDQETPILGHQGFLDCFTAVFRGDEFALELEPNMHLPGLAGGK